jgi:Ala-tRNA(Pro) deacylase
METCLERLKRYFTENGAAYEVREHREVYTAQEVANVLHEPGAHVAKVVMALIDDHPAMLVVAAPAHVDFQRVKAELRAGTARQAHEAEFKALFPDCAVGAMPPFGHLYNVPLHVDRALTSETYVVFQAGSHREAMKITTADFIRLAKPTIGEFSSHAKPTAI